MQYRDTCDWCGKGTNKIQIKPSRDFGLCPSCCPSLDEDELPDTDYLPYQWHFLSDEERSRWFAGEDVEDIIEEKYRNGNLRTH